jgi:hypothetical protein
MDILTRYDWPGNIREPQNDIERTVVLSRGSVLRLGSDLLPLSTEDPTPASEPASHSSGERKSDEVNGHLSLSQVEKLHILEILEKAHWVIEGNRAATVLGLHPSTLRSRMKRLGISIVRCHQAPTKYRSHDHLGSSPHDHSWIAHSQIPLAVFHPKPINNIATVIVIFSMAMRLR